jgi:hypothetical protein
LVSEDYEGISSLLNGMFSSPEARRSMSANQHAAYVWHNVNGDVERAHTTGVFLKEPHVKGAAPILGVYVDSRMRAVDFRANREVYRARLSMGGLEISEIEFIVSQYGHGAAPRKNRASGETVGETLKPPLPELTGSEQDTVEKLAETAPESLRGSVYKAMSLSFRREKSRDTNDGTSRP